MRRLFGFKKKYYQAQMLEKIEDPNFKLTSLSINYDVDKLRKDGMLNHIDYYSEDAWDRIKNRSLDTINNGGRSTIALKFPLGDLGVRYTLTANGKLTTRYIGVLNMFFRLGFNTFTPRDMFDTIWAYY